MTKDELFNRTAGFISKMHDFETSLSSQNRDDEVTSLQNDILQILFFSGPKNLSGISQCLNINLPNSSREVKKLTNLGYIKKSMSPEDKRKTELTLTDKGMNKVQTFLEQMKKSFFSKNSDWNRERIERCLESIDILEKEIFQQ